MTIPIPRIFLSCCYSSKNWRRLFRKEKLFVAIRKNLAATTDLLTFFSFLTERQFCVCMCVLKHKNGDTHKKDSENFNFLEYCLFLLYLFCKNSLDSGKNWQKFEFYFFFSLAWSRIVHFTKEYPPLLFTAFTAVSVAELLLLAFCRRAQLTEFVSKCTAEYFHKYTHFQHRRA